MKLLRPTLSSFALGLLLIPAGPAWASNESTIAGVDVVRSEAIVQLAEDVEDVEVALEKLGCEVIETLGEIEDKTFLVQLDAFSSTSSQINRLDASEVVDFAEPNYFFSVGSTSNDPEYLDGSLWGMQGLGTTPANQFGSNAASAWSAGYTGSSDVYVAVLDSGIDVGHPDLAANVWVNLGETAADGIDNDGNGFVDDINGYDFVYENGSVFDSNEHPHGTHVAGTIAAVGGNGVGVAGVAWNVKLISVKIVDLEGHTTSAAAIAGINYVNDLRTKTGLDIIAMNASWGGAGYSQAMEEAIQRGGDAGIVFVAAAGNGDEDTHQGRNLDSASSYPAEMECKTEARDWDCLVSVAAIDDTGAIASFSDYSATKVDIGAPGVGVMSTYTVAGDTPSRQYQELSGTSMAAPHVTGAIALCVSSYRGTSAEIAIQKLFGTAVATSSLNGKVATNGRLDAGALVGSCVTGASAFSGAHADLYASAIYTDRVRLDWSDAVVGDYEQEIQVAVGPSGCTGTFTHFAYIGPGLTSYPVSDLDEAHFYCFRIRANVKAGASLSYSSYVKSNVVITWTSNLPFVYGKVYLSDGITPVANAQVKWVASGTYQSISSSGVVVKTDEGGNYVTQVSNGTPGVLSVVLPITVKASAMTTPPIPWGLTASGELTVEQDTVVDFDLPAQHLITLRVTDGGTPVAGAKVGWDSLAKYCVAGSYVAFVGATNSTCQAWPFGTSGSTITTDASGEVTLAFPDSSLLSASSRSYTISATHPSATGRYASATISPFSDSVVNLEMAESATITGKVLLDDGVTPVSNAPVYWLPKGVYDDTNDRFAVRVVTDGSGNYSMPASVGIEGRLYVSTPISAGASAITSPRIPWGLDAGGKLTVNSNTTKDIKLPKQQQVTFEVREYDTNALLQNAKVQFSGLAEYCRDNTYLAFEGATGSSCQFWPTGSSSSRVLTNAQGVASIAVLDNQYFNSSRVRKYSVIHPTITSRIAELSLNVSADATVPVTMPAPVTVTGKVFASDGITPIAGAAVKWVADAQYASMGFPGTNTTTDANGNYTLQISSGTPGELFVETSAYAVNGPIGSPQLPYGLHAGGSLTLIQDSVINLTMPEQNLVTITAREMSQDNNGDPVANGQIKSPVLAKYCSAGGYVAFPGATGSNCSFWPAGYSHSSPKTNASGVVTIPVLNARYFGAGGNTYTFSVVHPMDPARIKTLSVTPTANLNTTVEMPGTPSQPEQPSVTPSNNAVTLNWTEPWNGGAFIDYYQVWISLSAEGPFELVSSGSCAGEINPTLRSCEVTGLTPGVTYYFAIIAKNEVGYSQMSAASVGIPTAAIQDMTLTPVPTISGTRTIGQQLTASAGSWDAGVILGYQWRRDSVAIAGANTSTYQLVAEDVGTVITVTVTGTKDGYNTVSKNSVAGPVITSGTLSLTPTPTVSGTAETGETLTVTPGSWDAGVSLAYQWFAGGAAIVGAISSQYTLTESELGSAVTVKVTGTKAGYSTVVKASAATAAITAPAPVVVALSSQTLTPTPTVTGDPFVGSTLIGAAGSWDAGTSLTYRWLRNGVVIPGATGTSYELAAVDSASLISFEVTSTKADHETVVTASNQVGPVSDVVALAVRPTTFTLSPVPTISGVARVGTTLTATVGTWDDGAILEYQWLKDGVAIYGATTLSYALIAADLGSEISFRVTATKSGFEQVVRESTATSAVTAAVVGVGGGGGGGGGGAAGPLPTTVPVLDRALPAGKKLMLVDASGAMVEVSKTIAADGKRASFTAGGLELSLSAGTGLEVSEDGDAKIVAGSSVSLSASGYQPNSTVTIYLIPQSYLQLAVVGFGAFATAKPISLGTTMTSKTGQFALDVTPNAPAANYILQIAGFNGEGEATSLAMAVSISGQTTSDALKATWTKKIGSSAAKIYAKNIVGAGKVQFFLNGKELAWVNASSAEDSKLRTANGASYLVRTVKFAAGKNVLEVYVDGVRTTRTAYTK